MTLEGTFLGNPGGAFGYAATSDPDYDAVTHAIGSISIANLTVTGDLTIGDDLTVTNTLTATTLQVPRTPAPVVTAGVQDGTSPPTPTAVGNNLAGEVSVGSGTAIPGGTGVLFTVTFTTPYPVGSTVLPFVQASDVATSTIGTPVISAVNRTAFSVTTGSPAASQPVGTYKYKYFVVVVLP